MFCLIFSMFINSVFGLVIVATLSMFLLTQSRAKVSSQSKFFLGWDIFLLALKPENTGTAYFGESSRPSLLPPFRVFLLREWLKQHKRYEAKGGKGQRAGLSAGQSLVRAGFFST